MYSESTKIINLVKEELCIDKILSELQHFDFSGLVSKKSGNLIKYLSTKLGFSLKIMCPPVKSCLLCERKLTLNNKPTQVVVHSVTGPEIYSKYIYRCRNCKFVRKSKVNKTANKRSRYLLHIIVINMET